MRICRIAFVALLIAVSVSLTFPYSALAQDPGPGIESPPARITLATLLVIGGAVILFSLALVGLTVLLTRRRSTDDH